MSIAHYFNLECAKDGDNITDENLKPYFKCLNDDHKNWTVTEERHLISKMETTVTPANIID